MNKKPINVDSPETLRVICSNKIFNINTRSDNAHKKKEFFSYWLAGVIDGDGSLLLSRAGYTSCEITVGEQEWHILSKIKQQLGGRIVPRSGVRALRWRLHNKRGMCALVNLINGKCLTPERQKQLSIVYTALGVTPCEKANREKLSTKLITLSTQSRNLQFVCPQVSLSGARASPNPKRGNDCKCKSTQGKLLDQTGWCAGFFEAEGYFHVNSRTFQCSLTLSQKSSQVLKQINRSFPGSIYYDKSWNGWVYASSGVEDLSRWLLYFSKFPLSSCKQIQLRRFKKILLYKERGVHLQKTGRSWKRFQRLVDQFAPSKRTI